MRGGHLLFCLLTAACAAAPPPAGPLPTRTVPEEVRLSRAAAALAGGSLEAEALLVAIGPRAVPFVRPLLDAPDENVRRVALRILVDSGEDMGITVRERVGLLLSDLHREEPHPWASLRAIARLRGMGEEARSALEDYSGGEGPEGEAARRLLRSWGEP